MIEIEHQLLTSWEQALLAVMIIVIMFGMGSTLTVDDFRQALKRPRGMLIGFFSQFGLMPLLAFTLAHLLNLHPVYAIGLIMIGCLPGGSTSNMFAYFAFGSVALSISMTAASTALALFMMPLLLELYASGFAAMIDSEMRATGSEQGFVIPHLNIIISLLLVLVPVMGGMILRRFSTGWSKVAEDTAGFTAILVILFLLGSVSLRNGQLFLVTPWKVYAGAFCVGVVGFALGYALASVPRLVPRYRRAIALETGIQNGPIAFAIIMLSFNDPLRSQMLWLPILYSTFIVMSASGVTLFLRRIGRADWELYRNDLVHKRLFGEGYATVYPADMNAGKYQDN